VFFVVKKLFEPFVFFVVKKAFRGKKYDVYDTFALNQKLRCKTLQSVA